MSDYKIIAPPFTLKFREMSKEALKAYYNWYIQQIPERISILSKTIQNTPGYRTWNPDYSPDSLDNLGSWFAEHVEIRERTKKEIGELKAKAPVNFPSIEYPNWDLTNRIFSLALDIGMYLSQVFLRNCPSLKWHQRLTGKTMIDYGRPALIGFGKMTFEPTHMVVVLAYSFAEKNKEGSSLREIFNTWKNMIPD